LDDVTYNSIEQNFPFSAANCPTCGGAEKYRLDGEEFDCDCELQIALQKHYFAANIGREYHDICIKDFLGVDRENVLPIVQNYIDK
jgi:hypothetical protein